MLPWLVVILLIGVNAFYVAAEFAAVAVQRSQLELLAREGNRRALRLFDLLEDRKQLDRYVSACQIGITLASLVAGAYAQATIAPDIEPLLGQWFGVGDTAARSFAFLFVLLLLTTVQVVLGELVPKALALQFPEKTALATFLPVSGSVALYRGFIWLLNGSGARALKAFGVTPGGHEHVHSPEEIAILLAESHRGGTLSTDAHQRLERGLQLYARTVRQMMTPRHEVYGIEASTPPEEILKLVQESPYTRLPVYRDSFDHVLGAISTKDVVALYAADGKIPPLEKLLRPIPFVPDTLRSHRFVRYLQQQRSSKAIVVNEHGGVQGMISIEDVLGELFGEITDELKTPEAGAEPLPDGTVRLPGAMRLIDAEAWLGTRWESPATTVSGHIVTTVGQLPKEGDRLEIDGVGVTITEMSPTAVRWVTVEPIQKPVSEGSPSVVSPADLEENG